MAVRLLAYPELLRQKLVRRRESEPARELPPVSPVSPVVLCNGRGGWKAADEAAKPTAPGNEPLAPRQPALRYFVSV